MQDRPPETPPGALSAPGPAAVRARVARGGGVLLARHGIGFALNAGGGIVLARELGPALMGLYFAAYTLFTVGRQLVDFCVSPHLIRDPGAAPRYAAYLWLQRVLAGSFVLVGLGGLAAGLALHLAPVHARELGWLVGAAVLGAASFAWQSVPVADLERRLEYRRVGWIEVLEPLTFNVVAVALVVLGAGVHALAVALVLRGLVPALAAARLSRVPQNVRPAPHGVRRLAGELLPLVGAQATLWAILAAPAVLLGTLAGPEELGFSQLAYSLLGSIGIPAVVFQRISFAALSRLQTDAASFERAVRRSLLLLAAFYLPLLSLLGSFAPLWVPRICGAQWTPMAAVLASATLPVALASSLGIVYVAVLSEGRNRLVWWQNLLHAVIYWAVLALAARGLGALAVPVAHLAALPAGILYYRDYRRRHAALRLPGLGVAWAGGTLLSLVCWRAVTGGRAGLAVLVWVAAMAIVLPWTWRRLGVGALLRHLQRGGDLEVSGV